MQHLGLRQAEHDIGSQSNILYENRNLLQEIVNHQSVSVFDDVNTGWTQEAATFAWDTADYVSGDRSGRLTTTSGSYNAVANKTISANISNSNVGLWLKRSSTITYVTVFFLCPDWSNYISYSLPLTYVPHSMWTFVSFATESASKVGNPNYTNATQIRIEAGSAVNTATLRFDRVLRAPNVLPTGAIIICFDDGYDSDFLHAKKKMDEYGYAGVSFINPPMIGQAGRLTLDQLDKMRNTGWDICSHTWSHPYLTSLPSAQVHEEIIKAKNWLREGGYARGARFFAYPYSDVNTSVHSIVSQYHSITRLVSPFSTTRFSGYPLFSPYTIDAVDAANTTPANMLQWIQNVKSNMGLGMMLFHKLVASNPSPYEHLIADFNTFIDNIFANQVPVITLSTLADRYLTAPVSTFEPTAWLNLA